MSETHEKPFFRDLARSPKREARTRLMTPFRMGPSVKCGRAGADGDGQMAMFSWTV
jgi:hypothetical protein